VSDDDLGRSLAQSAERRVRRVKPAPNVAELLDRLERRSARQKRVSFAAIAAVLVIGSIVGYAIGHSGQDPTTPTSLVALDDGAPGPNTSSVGYEPANVDVARADIAAAFRDAFDGSVPEPLKSAATQGGASTQAISRRAKARAAAFGFTAEQLAGTTISVLGTSFIDETHAIVRFTLTVPGHGAILTDRVGYAVVEGSRWKVALRTVCDLLSLDGLGGQCPPAR
jgi:hypothetical protein